MNTDKLLETIIDSAMDVKALDPITIDFCGKSSVAEYLFICHGTSNTHIKGIVANIEKNLKAAKILPLGVEGRSEGLWVLMDYNAVLVHVFIEEFREFYNLEELYSEYKITHLKPENE